MPPKRLHPNQLLAESLKVANSVAKDGIIRSDELARGHKERLVRAQWLTEIIKGWYLFTSPSSERGSTAWFGGFWAFIKHYCESRFGKDGFCLSAESSLNLHASDTAIPRQIVILTKKESNTIVNLPFDTSILAITEKKSFPEECFFYIGVPIMPLVDSLCRVGPSYYQNNPQAIEIILKINSLSIAAISRYLLKTQDLPSAERIIGALHHFSQIQKAKQITQDLATAGYQLKSVMPFKSYVPTLLHRPSSSPQAARIRLKWEKMREVVLNYFPQPPEKKAVKPRIIKKIRDQYTNDAYHSLSIEGYQVTEELIEKIGNGLWDPDNNSGDKSFKDALAAKGYLHCFEVVMKSVEKMLEGKESGRIIENDLQSWYRELFKPQLHASLVPMDRLAGYRNSQVYITNSRHVPPSHLAILDCMETFFDLLKNESSPAVRAVLGHFIFVYIHPYLDGNGRIARFIMNVMLISGGYNWLVIRVDRRNQYMESLEAASVEGNIKPFTVFLRDELTYWQNKKLPLRATKKSRSDRKKKS